MLQTLTLLFATATAAALLKDQVPDRSEFRRLSGIKETPEYAEIKRIHDKSKALWLSQGFGPSQDAPDLNEDSEGEEPHRKRRRRSHQSISFDNCLTQTFSFVYFQFPAF